MSHENNGACLSCAAIFNKYAGFYQPLRDWFSDLQDKNPEAHISCAGRGRIDQEALYNRHATRAQFGQSAHNWNAAIDIFRLFENSYNLDLQWFLDIVAPALSSNLSWYGRSDAPFPERPHIEISAWSQMAKNGLLQKVE